MCQIRPNTSPTAGRILDCGLDSDAASKLRSVCRKAALMRALSREPAGYDCRRTIPGLRRAPDALGSANAARVDVDPRRTQRSLTDLVDLALLPAAPRPMLFAPRSAQLRPRSAAAARRPFRAVVSRSPYMPRFTHSSPLVLLNLRSPVLRIPRVKLLHHLPHIPLALLLSARELLIEFQLPPSSRVLFLLLRLQLSDQRPRLGIHLWVLRLAHAETESATRSCSAARPSQRLRKLYRRRCDVPRSRRGPRGMRDREWWLGLRG